MKIYSNFQDYYDCALGSFIESDVEVVRKSSIVTELYRDMPDMRSYDGEYDMVTQSNGSTSYKFEQVHMVGFCGTWYFYVVLNDEIVYKTFDDIVQNNRKTLWYRITDEFVNPNENTYWKELFDKYGPILYCQYKKPTRYETGKKKSQQVMQIGIWPELKVHDFIQVKDPYSTLWEIEHWIDSKAKPDETPVSVGDDIVRLQAYGFDKKTSFRKAKEK